MQPTYQMPMPFQQLPPWPAQQYCMPVQPTKDMPTKHLHTHTNNKWNDHQIKQTINASAGSTIAIHMVPIFTQG